MQQFLHCMDDLVRLATPTGNVTRRTDTRSGSSRGTVPAMTGPLAFIQGAAHTITLLTPSMRSAAGAPAAEVSSVTLCLCSCSARSAGEHIRTSPAKSSLDASSFMVAA